MSAISVSRTLSRCLAAILTALSLMLAASGAARADSAPFTYCYSPNTQNCVSQWGYSGQTTWGYPVDSHGNNCTNYAAFRLNQTGRVNPGNLGDASNWAVNARTKGLTVFPGSQTPQVGDIAQWNYGHVAYVEWVSADGTQFAVSETGWGPLGNFPSMSGRGIFGGGGRHNEPAWPDNFIRFNGGTPAPGPDLTPPAGFTKAADEYSTFVVSQLSDVAFGANGQFKVKRAVTGTISCSVATFDDPVSGVIKACFVMALNAPAAFTYKVPEGATVQLGQRSDVAFGANGFFNIKRGVTGSITCSNAAFGDPAVGIWKSCFVLELQPPAGYTYAGTEDETVILRQRSDVAFGVKGKFVYKTGLTGAVPCTTASFTDPAIGIHKACYIRPNPYHLTATPQPTITGTAAVGRTLTATPHVWKPGAVTLAYQWKRNGTAIPGATSATFRLSAADKGATITVTVTGSKSDYTSVTKTSKGTGKVKAGTLRTVTPKISGKALVDVTLTAQPGTWTPAGVIYTYRWYRNSTPIKAATEATYTVQNADQGKRLRVKVYGHLTGYTTASRLSAKTSKVK